MQALRIELGVGITGYVAGTGRSVLAANALDCDFAIQIPGTETVDESVIAVPLRYGSRVTGVVFLSKLGVGQFDESDLRLLEVLAGYAAVSLENARLYESLRLEADHAKAWLEFADALSEAESPEELANEIVRATGHLLEAGVASLWLEDRPSGDFVRSARYGCWDDAIEEKLRGMRLPYLAAEALLETTASPRVIDASELAELYRIPEFATLGPVAIAPLPAGHGVRGWLVVGLPTAGLSGFNGERMRLLEGLAYRAAMALQKARLTRHQKQSVEIADALLGYARALARAADGDIEDCIVRLAVDILDANDVSLWLQSAPGEPLAPVAVSGMDADDRKRLFTASFPAEVAAPFSERPEPFVLTAEQYFSIPGTSEIANGADVAVAPFPLDGGRMGFLVAGARPGETFDELTLKTLAGLADQATLAIARA